MQEKFLQSRGTLKNVARELPQVLGQIEEIRELGPDSPGVADSGSDAELTLASTHPSDNHNPALDAWRVEQNKTA